ncbi:hypothetical protein Emag_000539 [Eimeria magna]
MVIKPKNWNLFSVNVVMAITGCIQLTRIAYAKLSSSSRTSSSSKASGLMSNPDSSGSSKESAIMSTPEGSSSSSKESSSSSKESSSSNTATALKDQAGAALRRTRSQRGDDPSEETIPARSRSQGGDDLKEETIPYTVTRVTNREQARAAYTAAEAAATEAAAAADAAAEAAAAADAAASAYVKGALEFSFASALDKDPFLQRQASNVQGLCSSSRGSTCSSSSRCTHAAAAAAAAAAADTELEAEQ